MFERIFTVKYVNIKDCFCYLPLNLRELHAGTSVKLVYGENQVAYFSVVSLSSLDDNVLGINSLYAKSLGIEEDNTVTLVEIGQLPSINTITICPVSKDDYEVLEILAENVQSTLLNQIRVVNCQQKFIIWIGGNINVLAFVVDIKPRSPGCLDNLTEVVIKTPEETINYNSTTISDGDANNKVLQEVPDQINDTFQWFLNSHEWKIPQIDKNNLEILQNFSNQKQKLIYRLIPLKTLSTKHDNNCFKVPFNVFISIHSLPTEWSKFNTVENPIICSISLLTADIFPKPPIYVRLCTFEEFVPNFSTKTDKHNIFAPDEVINYFECDLGSRAVLNFIQKYNPAKEIEICTKKNYLVDVVEKFKLYLADMSKEQIFVLNKDLPIDIGDNVTCSVNILPEEVNFCVVDQDFVGSCKFSICDRALHVKEVEKEKTDEFSYNLSVSNYQRIIDNAVSNFVSNMENVLITGRPGTGKSTILNILKKNLRDFPHYIYTSNLNCKSIKGKTLESLHKVFSLEFSQLILNQPSVLILDDLHVLCEYANEGDVLAQNAIYFNRISEMVHNFLKCVLKTNEIGVLATAESVSKLNKNIYSSRGSHLFKNVYGIEDLNKNNRKDLLQYYFSNYNTEDIDYDSLAIKTEGFVVQDLQDFVNKTLFEFYKENDDSGGISLTAKHVERALENTTALSLQDVHLHSPGSKDFSDIGGLENVKKILIESLLWPARYPNIFGQAPLRLQSGLLLYGPPGTGKTLLAGAAAKHCGLRLISIKGPELLSKYIGASEQAVRDVFEKAQSARPCILFFDEFDSLAPRRGHDNTGVTDRVVNQLLTQLDGVESLTGVCVLAATSRPDLLDPALLRPGRLDKQIMCSLPDLTSRLDILNVLSKTLQFSEEVDLKRIAENTEGFSGADLQSVLYTAQLTSVEHLFSETRTTAEEISTVITQKQLLEALSKTRPSLTNSERNKYERIYAKFEGGNIEDFKPGSRATLA